MKLGSSNGNLGFLYKLGHLGLTHHLPPNAPCSRRLGEGCISLLLEFQVMESSSSTLHFWFACLKIFFFFFFFFFWLEFFRRARYFQIGLFPSLKKKKKPRL